MLVSSVGTVAFTKREFAIGIVATGSSFGEVIYPIMVDRLIDSVGYPAQPEFFGFVVLATNLIPVVVLRFQLLPRKSGPPVDLASSQDKVFLVYTVATFLGFMGVYIPIFYISSYATDSGLNSELAFDFLPILKCCLYIGSACAQFLGRQGWSNQHVLLLHSHHCCSRVCMDGAV